MGIYLFQLQSTNTWAPVDRDNKDYYESLFLIQNECVLISPDSGSIFPRSLIQFPRFYQASTSELYGKVQET